LVYIEALLIASVAVILERLIARYLKGVSKRRDWPPHITNGLVLMFRLMILLSAVIAIISIGGGAASNLLVAYSALVGAAIGFASTRTLGNFIAGIFVFATRPFRVNDYVKMDNIEGIVEEITFNYTKIRTQSNNLVYVSNLKILDLNIVNYEYAGDRSKLHCYSINLSFDHAVPTKQLEEAFDSVIEAYSNRLARKPEYIIQRVSAFERFYTFLLYVKKPQEIFTLQPSFVRDIVEAWEKTKKQSLAALS
jgi:small conductance mechanosensitive channel